MLLEFSILLFNISVYYSITAFWLKLLIGISPSFPGFIILALAILVHASIRNGFKPNLGLDYIDEIELNKQVKRYSGSLVALFIPFLIFLFKPSTSQLIHIMPPIVLIAYLFITGNTYLDKDDSRRRFYFGLKFLLLILPGCLSGKGFTAALSGATAYLIVLLFFGVLMMRIARDPGGNQYRQGALLGIVLLSSGLFYYLDALGKLSSAFSFIYNNLLVKIIYGAIIGISYLVFGLFDILRKIAIGLGLKSAENLPELNNLAPTEEVLEGEAMALSESPILKFIGFTIIGLILALILIFFFKRLSERSISRNHSYDGVTFTREQYAGSKKEKRLPFFRPTNPREAVRYYYKKYLNRISSRGMVIPENATTTDIRNLGEKIYPGTIHGDIQELYSRARYSIKSPISSKDAKDIKAKIKELEK